MILLALPLATASATAACLAVNNWVIGAPVREPSAGFCWDCIRLLAGTNRPPARASEMAWMATKRLTLVGMYPRAPVTQDPEHVGRILDRPHHNCGDMAELPAPAIGDPQPRPGSSASVARCRAGTAAVLSVDVLVLQPFAEARRMLGCENPHSGASSARARLARPRVRGSMTEISDNSRSGGVADHISGAPSAEEGRSREPPPEG